MMAGAPHQQQEELQFGRRADSEGIELASKGDIYIYLLLN
jgi:hypothetical protein